MGGRPNRLAGLVPLTNLALREEKSHRSSKLMLVFLIMFEAVKCQGNWSKRHAAWLPPILTHLVAARGSEVWSDVWVL